MGNIKYPFMHSHFLVYNPFTHVICYSNCTSPGICATSLLPGDLRFPFFFSGGSCFTALCAHQEAVRLESNLNGITFTVTGSVILIIINPSTTVIHDVAAMSTLEQITSWFTVNSEVM